MSYKGTIKNVKIGSDPEMFLWSDTLNKFVPVCGLVGGTKDEPLPITKDGHFIQEDNVAVEFCIPPCTTSNEFVDHITFVKNYLQNTILNSLNLKLKCVSSAHFDYEDLKSEQAQKFGCDPDFNAYTYEENHIDKEKVNPLLRSAGFHIHIGYDNPNVDCSIELVKAFDLFVLVPSILIDEDTDRRELYGKSGSYRFKSYGVECRGLGAFLLDNEYSIKWVYEQAMRAVEFVNEGGIITNENEIQECINTSNKKMAMEIVEDYNINILKLEV